MKRALASFLVVSACASPALSSHLQPVPIDDVDGDGRADLVVATNVVGRQLMAVSSRGDHALWIFSPSLNYARGTPVVGICADRDGDGARDLAAAWTSQAVGEVPEHVLVAVHSSRTGRVLAWARVPCSESELPVSLIEAGDLDGDSRPELLLGTPGEMVSLGVVHVLAGTDLSARELARGSARDGRFGSSIALVGDLDADGVADFAVGAPGGDPFAGGGAGSMRKHGVVVLVSGRTGSTLRDLVAAELPDAHQTAVWTVGRSIAGSRHDGSDAAADVWMLARERSKDSAVLHRVSSSDGKSLEKLAPGIDVQDLLGTGISTIGDWDGDGSDDVLLHDPEWPRDELGGSQVADAQRGHVRIVGTKGELAHWTGANAYEYLGSRVAVASDLDGDGHRDVWITVLGNRADPEVRSYSGVTGRLLRRLTPTKWGITPGRR